MTVVVEGVTVVVEDILCVGVPTASLLHPLSSSSSPSSSPSPPCLCSPKGYGFVDFENPTDAFKAVQALQAGGVLAQFAKVPQVLPPHLPHMGLG